MKILLDYDNTFTLDKSFFTKLVKMAKSHGHEIKIVTYRYENDFSKNSKSGIYTNDDIIQDALNLEVPLIFTNGTQKYSHYPADIFIEDSPVLVPDVEQLYRQLERIYHL